MEKVINDNLSKLRELTNKIADHSPEGEYELVLKSLKNIITEGKDEVITSSTPQKKIKCYEKMCTQITSILNNVNF